MKNSASVRNSAGSHGAVEVEATAEFPDIGSAASNIRRSACVQPTAGPARIARLLRETDAVAEVHGAIRSGVAVQLVHTG